MNYQKTYKVTLIGATKLLLHGDNVDFSAKVKAWTKDPANKQMSVAGDDRTPAWTWLGCLYGLDFGGRLVMAADNIMAMLRDGGTKTPAKIGRGSMKAQTQSGIICNEIGWPLVVKGHEIPSAPLKALMSELDFNVHEKVAREAGFELFVKRATIGSNKHVRVRPWFEDWSCSGTVTVVDPTITADMLQTILNHAGNFCGLGDWRPSSPKPGPWGRFTAEIQEVK